LNSRDEMKLAAQRDFLLLDSCNYLKTHKNTRDSPNEYSKTRTSSVFT